MKKTLPLLALLTMTLTACGAASFARGLRADNVLRAGTCPQ